MSAHLLPLLVGRFARCCEASPLVPSAEALTGRAFFRYHGPGSESAETLCKHCGYAYVAHTVEGMANNVPNNRRTVIERGLCTGFEAKGPAEHDEYYCGHSGWD